MSEEKIPRAIREAKVKIGEAEFGCAVLDDEKETRVLTQQTFLRAIGRSRPAGGEIQKAAVERLPVFLSSPNLNPFISEELRRSSTPLFFRPLRGGGRQTAKSEKGTRSAIGFDARILPEVCRVFVEARDKGELNRQQEHIAEKCDRLLRGLAGIGIIALIDEATGYQYDRDRDALRKILEAYINPELLPWTQRFPHEYFKELFRLRGWTYNPSLKGPRYVGKLTNELIYGKLPPGVLNELRERNPPDKKGYRRHRHHQFLTEDVGDPHLEKQLVAVTTLMRAAPNWVNFERMFKRAFPSAQGELALVENELSRKESN